MSISPPLTAGTSTHSNTWRSRRARVPGWPFWLFFAASLLFNFGFSTYFFLYSLFLVNLGFTEASIGRISAALSLGTIAGTLPIGLLAGRFGVRRVMLVCLPLAALATATRALVPAYIAQLALSFLTGMTLCAWGVCLAPAVANLTNEDTRPFAFSAIFASGVGVVGAGSFAGSRLPAWLAGHASLTTLAADQATLVFASAISLLTLIPLALLRLGTVPSRRPSWQYPHPFLLRFLPVAGLWSFVGGAFAPFAAVYFTRHFHLPAARVGDIFSFSQAVQCAAILLAPVLLRKLGIGAGIMTTQLMAALGLALLAATHSAAHAVWIYWLYIAMTYMSEPSLYSLLMEKIPASQRSHASAMHLLVTSLTLSVAASVTGSAITCFGYAPVFTVLAACGVAAAVLFRTIANNAFGDAPTQDAASRSGLAESAR